MRCLKFLIWIGYYATLQKDNTSKNHICNTNSIFEPINISAMRTNKYRKAKISLALVIVIAMMLNSCATLLSGSNQNLKIKSFPKGATVYLNGQNMYQQTPCKIKVERRQKRPFQFRQQNQVEIGVKKEGFKDADVVLESSFNVIAAGSIFFAGAPFLIDWMTGSHLKYPKVNTFNLEPIPDVWPESKTDDVLLAQKTLSEIKPAEEKTTYLTASFVDMDIPESNKIHDKRFALIIGNEDYHNYQSHLSAEINVSYALNDARIFREYAIKTMGIPAQNIIFIENATLAMMHRGLNKINLLAKNSYGEAELFFYYAGHGLPDENTKDPYILPVDVTGTDLFMAIKLQDVYNTLSEHPAKRITCVLDCCFSGGARNEPLVANRGVKIIPKESIVKGNMVVFAATTAEQTAGGYARENHGMFTYFFLKKLKESKGEVFYGSLYKYLMKNVPLQSVLVNNKEQTPQMIISPDCNENWKAFEF